MDDPPEDIDLYDQDPPVFDWDECTPVETPPTQPLFTATPVSMPANVMPSVSFPTPPNNAAPGSTVGCATMPGLMTAQPPVPQMTCAPTQWQTGTAQIQVVPQMTCAPVWAQNPEARPQNILTTPPVIPDPIQRSDGVVVHANGLMTFGNNGALTYDEQKERLWEEAVNAGFPCTRQDENRFKDFVDDNCMHLDWVRESIDAAIDQGIRTLGYLKGCIRNKTAGKSKEDSMVDRETMRLRVQERAKRRLEKEKERASSGRSAPRDNRPTAEISVFREEPENAERPAGNEYSRQIQTLKTMTNQKGA